MSDAWGGSWGVSWGVSWGSGTTPPVDTTDHHDGGYSQEEYDQLRRRIREAEKASRKEREKARQRLSEELDRAYRKVVLNEPEVALEVADAVVPVALAEAEPDQLPNIDWRAFSDILDTAGQVLAILGRDRQRDMAIAAWNAAEEDDIQILLLC